MTFSVARSRRRLALLLAAASMVSSGPTIAQANKRTPATSPQKLKGIAARIHAIVASGRLAELRWPNFSNYKSQVAGFYRPFGYEAAWLRNGQPTAQAVALVEILRDADREGLRAEDYDASRWVGRLASLAGPHDDGEEARFDAALTLCVMRYLSDLHVGRINPQHLGFEFDVSLQQVRSGKLTARQPPGDDNALGLVKFIFPNKYHVYIHDTPVSVPMFSGDDRTFSHGCIHVQEPAKLAAWLLRNQPGWDLPGVEFAMHKGPDNVRVNLAQPVPVLIVYDTAVVEENGEIHFFQDIYGHDAELKQELAKGSAHPE